MSRGRVYSNYAMAQKRPIENEHLCSHRTLTVFKVSVYQYKSTLSSLYTAMNNEVFGLVGAFVLK